MNSNFPIRALLRWNVFYHRSTATIHVVQFIDLHECCAVRVEWPCSLYVHVPLATCYVHAAKTSVRYLYVYAYPGLIDIICLASAKYSSCCVSGRPGSLAWIKIAGVVFSSVNFSGLWYAEWENITW